MALSDFLEPTDNNLEQSHLKIKTIMNICEISKNYTDFCYIMAVLNSYDIIPANALLVGAIYHNGHKEQNDIKDHPQTPNCTRLLLSCLLANSYINDESIYLYDIYVAIMNLYAALNKRNIICIWNFPKDFPTYEIFNTKLWDLFKQKNYYLIVTDQEWAKMSAKLEACWF